MLLVTQPTIITCTRAHIRAERACSSQEKGYCVPFSSSVEGNSEEEKVNKLISSTEKYLHIHHPSDWYHVPKSNLSIVPGGRALLKKFTTVEAIARTKYPHHPYQATQFLQRNFKPQMFLKRILQTVFPGERMEVNTRALGIRGKSGVPLEVDVYLPRLVVGFEYQDPHHYFHSSYGSSNLHEYQLRDSEKQVKAASLGITLINIPFWWDWSVDSLVATIKSIKPDLLPAGVECNSTPIQQDPPQHILDKFNFDIPDFGIPMLAMYTPQAKSFFPLDWWIFEKYDGIRAVWNGKKRILYSRWGSVLSIPNYIEDSLCEELWLDGELWFGREKETRRNALRVSSSLKGVSHTTPWDKLQLMVFDVPLEHMIDVPYRNRYAMLQKSCPTDHPFVKVPPFEVCVDRDFVETFFFQVCARGGEGVILRDPDAIYAKGYSRYMYKHKGFRDAEAKIIQKIGELHYICRVHKLSLQHNNSSISLDTTTGSSVDPDDIASGLTIDIPMRVDIQGFDGDASDLLIGNFVSFRYIAENNGIPVSPKIYAKRPDITSWNQSLHGKQNKPSDYRKRIWRPPAQSAITGKDVQSNRKFFDQFAQDKSFDPLVPDNWYPWSNGDFMGRGGKGLLTHYGSSLVAALRASYPQLSFNEFLFANKKRKFWKERANTRAFFDNFATTSGFSPYIPENWYNISPVDIASVKNGDAILATYGESFIDALRVSYPDVQFLVHKFNVVPRNYWSDKNNRRKFFDTFAIDSSFEPLQSTNWYSVQQRDLLSCKGASSLLRYYNGSHVTALIDVYDDINLERHKFISKRNFWDIAENRKQFFDKYALSKGFDPLIAGNWYGINKDDLRHTKGAQQVLQYYGGLIARALTHVYNNHITFDKNLMCKLN